MTQIDLNVCHKYDKSEITGVKVEQYSLSSGSQLEHGTLHHFYVHMYMYLDVVSSNMFTCSRRLYARVNK